MNNARRAVALVVFVAISGVAMAGVLRVGSPRIDGDKVVFPVLLDGEAGAGVSALNFNFQYDPQVLAPYGANNISAGAAAAAANKQVVSNVKAPGECTVIMMGMNQSSLESGEVASIVMRKVADPQGGRSSVAISQTTLASAEGTEIPSKGSRASVQFSDGTTQTLPDENPSAQDASAPANTPLETLPPALAPTQSRPGAALPSTTAANATDVAKETTKSQGPISSMASPPVNPSAPSSPIAPNAATPSNSQQLAAALGEASRARSSLPVPASGSVAPTSGEAAGLSGVAAQSINVAGTVYALPGASAQAIKAAGAVYAPSGASAQAVKVASITSAPSGEGGASSAKPTVAPKTPDGPTGAKRSARTKVIVVVVLAVVMVGGFLIRRRIFS